MKYIALSIAYMFFLSLVVGCSSGSSGGGGGGGGGGGQPPPGDPYEPDPGDPGNGGPLIATFASIQANVFDVYCIGCHSGALAPEGLMLDTGNSYSQLVDVASVQVDTLQRVEPGNPDDSYLIRKLEGTAAFGARMPEDGPPLPQSTIDVIRQWITEGATLNTSASTHPVQASGASIVPHSVIAALPGEIIVMFDRELDASTVHAISVTLDRSGGDGRFDSGNEVQMTLLNVEVPLLNPRSVRIMPDTTGAVADVYRLTLSGSPPSPILDLAGNRLDGGWVQSFPSGDGTEGGDLVVEFTVQPDLP